MIGVSGDFEDREEGFAGEVVEAVVAYEVADGAGFEAVELAGDSRDGLKGQVSGAEAVHDVAEVDDEAVAPLAVPLPYGSLEDEQAVPVISRHSDEGPSVGDVCVLDVRDHSERE